MRFEYTTKQHRQELEELRREFHQYPEVGFTEYRTSMRIADYLKQLGYQVLVGEDVSEKDARMGVPAKETLTECEARTIAELPEAAERYLSKMRDGMTGVIGILKGKNPGPVTALRFDIDALPLQEDSKMEYVSGHPGIMHACGHDGHISVGLVTAKIISEHRECLTGEVRLIFQSAEEGCRGAKAIVAKGHLQDVDFFLGGHIGLDCTSLGQIYACKTGFLATTKMNLVFHGVSAHAGKEPEKGKNALLASADFTVSVYKEVEKLQTDDKIRRINVGILQSGSGRNIIADQAYLEIETRGSDTESDQLLQEKIRSCAEAMAKKYEVSYEMTYVGNASSAKSSESLVQCLKKAGTDIGNEIDYCVDGHMSASEDVTWMMQEVQQHGGEAAYYLFGTKLAAQHHQKTFDFDEAVLPIMTEFYCLSILRVISMKSLA